MFLYFVFCSHDVVCLFLCIFQYSLFEYLASFRFFKVMLSCGIVIFHSSPTNKTSAKTALIIFNIFTFSVFELLSVLAWAFFHKNHFTVFNTELINRFHRVNMVFLGICIVYIDKIYNLFYVLPFFDSVFQLLNRCSNYFNQHKLSYGFVRFISVYIFFYIHIHLKQSFRCVAILWHNVQTGDFQNLKTSSVYYRSCLKHI